MPSYWKKGEYYFVGYQSGPVHVLISVHFGNEMNGNPEITRFPCMGECDHGELNESQISESVLEGVSIANTELNGKIFVQEIQYVANDTPNYEIYSKCGYWLTKAVLNEHSFHVIEE